MKPNVRRRLNALLPDKEQLQGQAVSVLPADQGRRFCLGFLKKARTRRMNVNGLMNFVCVLSIRISRMFKVRTC